MVHSTADAYIYALGGGRGHGARGSLIANALIAQGYTTELWRGLTPPAAEQRPNAAALLVVDTFAKGWRGELSDPLLRCFDTRILVSRYARYTDWDWVNRHYDQVIFPYCTVSQEWRADELAELHIPTRHSGLMVRDLAVSVNTETSTLTVLDPEKRLTPSSLAQLTRFAQKNEFTMVLIHEFSNQLDLSPKTVVIGAGYNLFYELLLSPADVRFLPVNKRYDDQARRCRNWQLAVADWDELQHWLRAARQHNNSVAASRYTGEL
ncbi:MAG: hypothetical protein HY080_10505 [Gammaproteobacteria bacterium]|nr:hypothetical protein [Gammaproteobacteria bacterium]